MTNARYFAKNKLKQNLLVAALGISGGLSVVHAGTMGPVAQRIWQPVAAVGGGVAIVTNAGRSQNFPIVNPAQDQFYNYSASNATKTSGMFDGFLGIELNLFSDWAVQFGVDYNVAKSFSANGALLQGADLQSADLYTYQYQLFAQQVLAESKILYTYKERFHPYFVGGLGAGFVNATNYNTNVPPSLTFTQQYANNANTSFSWAVGGGIDVDVMPHLRLGVGYRYADFGAANLGAATINGVSVPGTLTQSNFYENQVIGQLTWLFG